MGIISRQEAKALGLLRFYTGKPCKRKHYSQRYVSSGTCLACEEIRDKERYEKERERRIAWQKQYYEDNKEQKLAYDKAYQKRTKRQTIRNRERYQTDPVYRMKRSMRSLIRNTCLAIQNVKNDRTHILLGYSPKELKEHIEGLFQDGMSWDNYGEWHIDHRKPINAFIHEGITDPAVINALDNLQPLWALDNLIKGDYYNGRSYKSQQGKEV